MYFNKFVNVFNKFFSSNLNAEEANSIYAREWNRNSSDIEGSCWAELLAGRNEREAAKQEALRQKKITMKQKKKGRKKRR